MEKTSPHEQEAIIGSCFILAASGVMLALANHPQGGEEIQHILSGQILFISWSNVLVFLPLFEAFRPAPSSGAVSLAGAALAVTQVQRFSPVSRSRATASPCLRLGGVRRT